MLQLVYISTARNLDRSGLLNDILAVSRHNNAADAITGLLFFDGKRFLQALEGPPAAVERAFARIRDDARHFAVVELSRRSVTEREFGAWAMAAGSDDAMLDRVEALVAGAAPAVRATFNSFARLRRAA